jgi:hypothetical protein
VLKFFVNRSLPYGGAREDPVSKTPPAGNGADKRRSTRLTLSLPITVIGVDPLHEPFAELTRTVMISCHGCKYISKHYVSKGSELTLEIPRGIPKTPPRRVTAKVAWLQRPRDTREMLHIAVNLNVPGNVWDIPMPPEDWFPLPGEPAFALDEPPPPPPAPPPPAPVTLTASWDASEILRMASRAEGREADLAAALQMAKSETATAVAIAVAEEVSAVQSRTEMQIPEAMQRALRDAIERLSTSSVEKLMERASERLAALVDEARNACEAAAGQLDAKIHKAVEAALESTDKSRHGRRGRRR